MKDFKWLRGIHKAKSYDSIADLSFEITRNPDTIRKEDKFVYQCRNASGKLMFDRKIDFGAAMVAINSWNGEVEIQESPPHSTRA